MRRAPLAALLALGASTLGGCMMGPGFRSPDPPRTGSYLAEGQPAELVAANIPGVKLVGHYKDTLGRTGTAVERDGETLVIDPNNGQLLADIEGNPNMGVSCGNGCVQYGVAYTYGSEGPATSAPAVP